MKVRQIKYFLVLCEEQNFTRAARRCEVSQPSLTNAIRALEHELGGPLFYRTPHTRVSELGQVLRPHFKFAVEAVDKAREIAACLNRRSFPRTGGYGRASRAIPGATAEQMNASGSMGGYDE